MLEPIRVIDHGTELTIPLDVCILYHGRDSIGGMVLGYRIMAWAIREMSPNKAPDRCDIRFRTAFPGPGLRDAVEMVSRACTRGAYEVLDSAPEGAPEGVYGHLYFEIEIGDQIRRISLVPGAVSEDFIRTGRATKTQPMTPELKAHWTELKEGLAKALINADFEKLLVRY